MKKEDIIEGIVILNFYVFPLLTILIGKAILDLQFYRPSSQRWKAMRLLVLENWKIEIFRPRYDSCM